MPPLIAAVARSRLNRRVLEWYAAEGRPLAFRRTADPWAILVSEVMAQQTQAARAAEAWARFIERYPTPAAFAAVSPATALREWQGLGYNRRAIALRRAAAEMVERHGGGVPNDLTALLALPGIGPYTARAVGALAFGWRVGAVDTNVRRVLGRAFGVSDPADLQALADELVPGRAPGTWTHALMDIGARLCKPRRPLCDSCPVRADCAYAAASTIAGDGGRTERRRDRSRRLAAAPEPFEATSRWLRGRVLDRLRAEPEGAWLTLDETIGSHGPSAVDRALAAMAHEGLLERGPGRFEARLPIQ